jgi:hypothetical protein
MKMKDEQGEGFMADEKTEKLVGGGIGIHLLNSFG